MKEYSYATRYKECGPLETIHRIRSILFELGILTCEDWKQDVEGYYSLNLPIIGANMFSNGKGTSYEYALASAYAELIERLQNLMVIRYNLTMSPEALEQGGFYYAPDEKQIGMDEVLQDDVLKIFTKEAGSEEEQRRMLEKWKTAGYYSGGSDFVALPFLSLKEGDIHYIPVDMLMGMYGSNGMCAGNTAEEALVQGISEVIERHVQFSILRDRIVPPTVPESYILEHCPHLHRMIEELESKGPFRIIVKDCSLGQDLPALAIIFADRKRKAYNVRFGAHPTFEIALERCLTELLQGKGLDDLSWMTEFAYGGDPEVSGSRNEINNFTCGNGYYPGRFFSECSSYAFSEFHYGGSRSNAEMLPYLISLIQEKGYDILVRDASFLGFPSFQVVIPFFSETNRSNHDVIELMSSKKEAANILMRLDEANSGELRRVAEYMRFVEFTPEDSITRPLHKAFKPDFPWNHIKRDLFLSSAYYKRREFKKAYAAMDRFLKSSALSPGKGGFLYYGCVKDYIGTRMDGVEDEEEISGILSKVYPADIVNRVFTGLRNPDEVFKNCARLYCYECGQCPHTENCSYAGMEKIYLKLKERYVKNVIDQGGNRRFCTCKKGADW